MGFRHVDYRIAWVCALPSEMAAARLILDETHPDLSQYQLDHNAYCLGRFGPHNVVITCLPSGRTGTVSAAEVIGQLRYSFRRVQLGLMVGIGGGAPSSDADIRLGDVVVSLPSSSYSGVIPYDFGKTTQDGHFVLTGSVNSPPPSLLSATSKLRANHLMTTGPSFHRYIDDAARNQPAASRPDTSTDTLYEAFYDHSDASSVDCSSCDPGKIVNRPQRSLNGPAVHYGLIASASQVMRHGSTRESLRKEYGVLCFEMEAAGLMNTLPSLVIRGICDYADSHKNKKWQFHAAVAAAAYAKELLEVLPSLTDFDYVQIENEKPATLSSRGNWELVKNGVKSWESLVLRMSEYDHLKAHRRLALQRLPGTTDWFLSTAAYKRWDDETHHTSESCIWCLGKVGCGKTMISSRVVDDQREKSKRIGTPLAYIYCDASDPKTLDPSFLLASLIKQLMQHLSSTGKYCTDTIKNRLETFYNPEGPVADLEDLAELFSEVFEYLPRSTFIIDGLHEMAPGHINRILEVLRELWKRSTRQRLFISSREELGHGNNISFATRIPLTVESVETDIQVYIETRLLLKTEGLQITDNVTVLRHIKQALSEKADGMFLWVYLQIEAIWRDCKNDDEIMSALENLPRDLAETYERCLDRVPTQGREHSQQVLKWVNCAARPLLVSELKEAVGFDFSCRTWNPQTLPSKSLLIGSCANLVCEDQIDGTVRLAHYSVKQFLQQRGSERREGYRQTSSEVEDLQCGELCVNYLSFDNFELQMQARPSPVPRQVLNSPKAIANSAQHGVLGRLSRFVLRSADHFETPEAVNLYTSVSTLPPDEGKYAFLSYARENWALHTSTITEGSPVWDKFKTLALRPNRTWRFQPWASHAQSRVSYLHALLVWATRERHWPLLSLVLTLEGKRSLRDAVNLPYAADGLTALHSAARLGFTEVVTLLLPYCNINSTGPNGMTALHYAAEKNHADIVRALLFQRNIKKALVATPSRSAMDGSDETALGHAIIHGSWESFMVFLELDTTGEMFRDQRGSNAIVLAAMNGRAGVLLLLLEKHIATRTDELEPEVAKSALHYGARDGHEAVVRLLIGQKNSHATEPLDFRGNTALFTAAIYERTSVLDLLLKLPNASVNHRNLNGETALFKAVERGLQSSVELLLKHPKIDVNTDDSRGRTPLMRAGPDPKGIIHMLLEHPDTNVNLADRSGWTALAMAVNDGHWTKVEILLDNEDVEVNCKNEWGNTPLSIAATNGSVEGLKLLLEHPEVDVNASNNGRRLTPLGLAVRRRRIDIVELLLAHKLVDVNHEDSYGRTPLSSAANAGSEELTRIFLSHLGVEVNRTDSAGQSALSLASERGYTSIVEALIYSPKVDVNTKDNHMRTPLHYAAKAGQVNVVRILEPHIMIDINGRDEDGWTPLHLAANAGREETVAHLVCYQQIEINARDGLGGTPLHLAAAAGEEDSARQLLIHHRIEANARNLRSQTPLHMAVSAAQHSMVKLLVNNPTVDVNARDGMIKKTPLHYAAERGFGSIVSILIDRPNVDINAQDSRDKTPVQLAVMSGNVRVVELFLGCPQLIFTAADIIKEIPPGLRSTPRHEEMLSLLQQRQASLKAAKS